jgi:hypothetical protein
MPQIRLGLPHPAPQHTLSNIQIAAGLRHRHSTIPDQLHRLELELAAEYPASHSRASDPDPRRAPKVDVAFHALNRMLQLGRLESVRIV